MRSQLQKDIRARLDSLPPLPKPVKRPAPPRPPGPYVKKQKGKTLEERFWLKATLRNIGTGLCWLWPGDRYTWTVAGVKRNPVLWAYEHFAGQTVPAGHYLKPGCGNADCINPYHMQVAERNADRRKLDPAQVEAIRRDPRSSTVVAREYGVVQSFVSMVRAGKRRQQRAGSSPVEAADKAA